MLNRLELENFKAWQHADLQFGKGAITGLFGTNSAGKTSLLQLLLLLKQTADATDRSLVLDLGGPLDVVGPRNVQGRDSPARRATAHELAPRLDAVREADNPRSNGTTRQALARSRPTRDTVRSRLETIPSPDEEFAYRFDGVEFKMQPKPGAETKFDLVTDSQEFRFIRSLGRKWPLPQPIKTHLFPNEVRNYFRTPNSSVTSSWSTKI